MSLVNLLSSNAKALNVNTLALQTISHNIANANVEGYSRQRVDLETSGPVRNEPDFVGMQVDSSAVTRVHSEFLVKEERRTQSLSEMNSARSELLDQMETAFPMAEQGIGFAAFNDVAARPTDLTARQVVLAKAQLLADRFAQSGQAMDAIQNSLGDDMAARVEKLNQLASRVADLNAAIISARGSSNQPPNDLLDRRDQAITEISKYVQVSTTVNGDGSIDVAVGNSGSNLLLVKGDHAARLVAGEQASANSTAYVATLAFQDGDTTVSLAADALGAGSLAGLLKFQSDDLSTGRQLLTDMAVALVKLVNDTQAKGQDLDGKTGAPLFASLGTPPVLANMAVLIKDPRAIAAGTTTPPTSYGNAKAMGDLLGNADGKVFGTGASQNITDAYAQALTQVGIRVQAARDSKDVTAGVAQAAATRRQAYSGVNLDEEAAELMRYQQNFQASAKVLQVAQSIFDAMNTVVSR